MEKERSIFDQLTDPNIRRDLTAEFLVALLKTSNHLENKRNENTLIKISSSRSRRMPHTLMVMSQLRYLIIRILIICSQTSIEQNSPLIHQSTYESDNHQTYNNKIRTFQKLFE